MSETRRGRRGKEKIGTRERGSSVGGAVLSIQRRAAASIAAVGSTAMIAATELLVALRKKTRELGWAGSASCCCGRQIGKKLMGYGPRTEERVLFF
jgi:hypothetical protein